MKILWLTNVALPEASLLMNEKATPFGGWLINTSASLVDQDDIELSIVFPKNGLSDLLVLNGSRIKFYAIPPVSKIQLNANNKYLIRVLDIVRPDIVHVFGTEYAHTLAMVSACNEHNISTVVSIQGLVSIYAKHYMACLPPNVQSQFTLRDFLKQDNLNQQQSKFLKRGVLEIKALQKVCHIIGRTTWDRACTYQINPDAQYHFVNETLRDEFYKHTWELDRCERYSIFLSQGQYPIKGLHFMLEAMPLIIKKFPNTKLYVGGQNITKTESLKDRLKISSYGRYIRELIERYKLQKNVVFTDLLDEKQMCDRHLKSHIFVCPSSIENSPNSLGEAMILGVPCVASNVGGVADLLRHKDEGFVYQTDAPYMLAYYVSGIFASDELALKISKKAREHAMSTYNRKKNIEDILKTYNNMLEKK